MEKKGPVFLDPALQRSFDENGFVKISLLDEAQVERLQKGFLKFKQQHEAINIPFITTSHSNDAQLITAVDELIVGVAEGAIKKHVAGCNILFSNFLLKRAGDDSYTAPHQDTTFVDERKYISFSIWLALEDIDEKNGAMKLLPGSHHFDFYLRPNPSFSWKYGNIVEAIEKDMITVATKKGEALIFAHSLIHASSKNLSKKNRLAAVISLYPQDAELYHFHIERPHLKLVQQYKMNKEAFLKYVKGAPPQYGKLIAEIPYENEPVTLKQYRRMKNGKNFFGRIKEKLIGA